MIHVGASLVGALVIFIRFHTGNVFMGTHKGSPYGGCIIIGDLDDGVKMVWHNHIFMAYNVGISVGQPTVFFLHHPSGIVQVHGAIGDGTEQCATVMHTDGNEIKTLAGIIVITQTNGTTVMYVRIIDHTTLTQRCLIYCRVCPPCTLPDFVSLGQPATPLPLRFACPL